MSNQRSSLKHLNTFALPAYASNVISAGSVETLIAAWYESKAKRQPVLLLGEGSNVLFIKNFSGTVLLNRIMGITSTEDSAAWYLHVGAGENWHQLVCHSLQNNMPGLENLALIPGCVGSAPIQNIGAYGVELKQVCEYVDLLDMDKGTIQRISAEECQFGYRDSIFKHRYGNGFAIVSVGIKLMKSWTPTLGYGDLIHMDPLTVTATDIFNSVCTMRRSKLPDPMVTGNAGSFFKNPVVSAAIAEEIVHCYPNAPHYLQPDGSVKLAAGWLIDQCSLKGYQIGGAAVHQQQALVLINQSEATGQDVIHLARYIRQQVAQRFSIWLEPEVRFIADNGEVNAVEHLS
ncbi:UDP-N-acetylmuramate dehydrogenase [Yersinia pseudotuberculosis]|uniref:UDP-N-acetylmuramate dehydrogenase n=1 Tax=Yersinia pseudotuberculosis TaxID=633 RepID=UPI001A9DBB6F|nr:UDP-N-acetylmuramate dehydrogenase [Yersinia pseudotuberculosis]MBO1552001.1 UDP-N-acetylmuramate dehydrogenase [Yersinia pseudotuberculosis]MBO1572231.1 UDP-N-acetylmuramate dehydrogenase [Yersinia pseudotuberculosis]MBO1587123.1 UDP-N-acetylmuramate dehydrogenase [Yersinia pseudotuberculosis]MBO1636626.1 UDP-N-acetylmuramate dehydrogenase [Yersinia pseudotuberculosis]